jgi:hypothetical protein
MVNENGYRLVKEIPSTTKAKAWHIQINKVNYQVVCAPFPRLFEITSVFLATKTGKILDAKKPLFRLKGNRMEDAAKELVKLLNGHPELKDQYYTVPEIPDLSLSRDKEQE